MADGLNKHMVERPIKKSEQQAKNSSSDGGDRFSSQPSEQPRADRSSRSKDRDRGKGGRGKGGKPEEPKAVNPALMRGPKPVKAKPPVIEEVTEAEAQPEAESTEDSQALPQEAEAE